MSRSKNVTPYVIGGFAALIVIWVVGMMVANQAQSRGPAVPAARLNQDPVLGDPAAPVQIVEYASYSCSSCRSLHQSGVMARIVEDFNGQVAYRYRDFPVIIPSYDRTAAQAAQCALDQDEALFWALHDRLYTTAYMAHSTAEEFGGLAAQVGLDGQAVAQCIEDGTHLQTISHDEQRARRAGAQGTPSLFINDEPLFAMSYDGIRNAVLAALDG